VGERVWEGCKLIVSRELLGMMVIGIITVGVIGRVVVDEWQE